MVVLAIVQTGIHAFGYSSVCSPYIRHVKPAAALAEVDFAVGANVFVGFVVVCVPHNKHFAEVHSLAGFAKNLVFKESVA